jgi:murein DD-endopeptidase MepM/ murein hydrolase activator NlpD
MFEMQKWVLGLSVAAFAASILSCASAGHKPSSNSSIESSKGNGAFPPGFTGPLELMQKGVTQGSEFPGRLLPNGYRVDLDWPVDKARFVRGFYIKDPQGRRRRPHLGIDLAAAKETPIFAAHPGRVIYVGHEFRGYGKLVMIEGFSRQYATLYAHLNSTSVKEGQRVQKGDLIGGMGRTGRATGVHLHFEFRTAQGALDPLPFLPEPRPREIKLTQNHR